MRHVRDLSALILAMTLLQAAGGMMATFLPLDLSAAGASAGAIGLTGAAYAAAFLAGGFLAPRLMARMGAIRAYAAFAASLAAVTLALYANIDPLSWIGLRAIQGFCFVGLYTVAEGWMSEATPSAQRGSVLGVYHVATKIALMAGPFLLLGAAPMIAGPYMASAAVVAVALIPLCWTRQREPDPPEPEPYPIDKLWRVAPAAAIACFAAGVLNAGLLAILPLYAEALDGEALTIAILLQAAAWSGGIVLQWPAGRLSDLFDRRIVIAGLGGFGLLGAGVLTAFGSAAPLWLALGMLGVWGAGSLSYYGVAVAHASDHVDSHDITRAISGLLVVYGVGAILGPGLFGWAYQLGGARALFGLAAGGSLLLALGMVYRSRASDNLPAEEKEDFAFAPGTSSPSIAAADPRAEEA